MLRIEYKWANSNLSASEISSMLFNEMGKYEICICSYSVFWNYHLQGHPSDDASHPISDVTGYAIFVSGYFDLCNSGEHHSVCCSASVNSS